MYPLLVAVPAEGGIINVVPGSPTGLSTQAFDRPMRFGPTFNGDSEMTLSTALTGVPFASVLPGFYTFYREDPHNQSCDVVGGGATIASRIRPLR